MNTHTLDTIRKPCTLEGYIMSQLTLENEFVCLILLPQSSTFSLFGWAMSCVVVVLPEPALVMKVSIII